MKIDFSATKLINECTEHLVAVGSFKDGGLSEGGKLLDKVLNGMISKSMQSLDFKGKIGDAIHIKSPENVAFYDVILFGVGEASNCQLDFEKVGAKLGISLSSAADKLFFSEVLAVVDLRGLAADEISLIANGLRLNSWNFDKYFTTEKTKPKRKLKGVKFLCDDPDAVCRFYKPLELVTNGVFLTREVVSEVPNVLYPETFAKIARKELEPLGATVEVLNEDDMASLGMNSLLAVGMGSEKESKLCVIRWLGADNPDAAPVAFVGKGVTFDTGGISIKPANNMHEMKYDMAGGGAVLGLMKALAGRKAKVNAVGVIGLVENMPSGSAQRPGDVVKSMSGQTIECLNTDAEGRMVLADALWYTQDRFSPKFMVNLATLTGAITVALGQEHAGLFSNNDKLSDELTESGKLSGDALWRMPMGDVYDKAINSTVADMKNIGDPGTGGSITAAQFLQRHVNGLPWAHLDIAGMAWADKSRSLCNKGASGFGVRLLDALVEKYYEDK